MRGNSDKGNNVKKTASALCQINVFQNVYFLIKHKLFPCLLIWFTHHILNTTQISLSQTCWT